MEIDDAARKVRGLLRMAAGTGDEAVAAKAKAEALITKFGLDEDDLDAENDEPNQYLRQYKKFDRLQRDVFDSYARLADWLGKEDQEWFRGRDTVFDALDRQHKLLKNRLKKCAYCKEDGFGEKGPTERFNTGFRNNRRVYDDLHQSCYLDWREYQKKLKEKFASG